MGDGAAPWVYYFSGFWGRRDFHILRAFRARTVILGVVDMAKSTTKKYRPTEREAFMNERMKGYFRERLLEWRSTLLRESDQTLQNLQASSTKQPDLGDRASLEAERSVELRTRDRERKLISKIDAALRRIQEGTFGFCDESGEPISLKRLIARPIATMSLEAQERHELMERTHRDG